VIRESRAATAYRLDFRVFRAYSAKSERSVTGRSGGNGDRGLTRLGVFIWMGLKARVPHSDGLLPGWVECCRPSWSLVRVVSLDGAYGKNARDLFNRVDFKFR